ncbi:acidic phospholipase A2 2-like [Mytilus californianus]|uniref:acidic phospholipase A2 2-like n=1 Tax=Mytilus californianus TaxID=6549 RepID=UPI002245C17E|nr:acidic phospholipase A2 2-like [Mytilus californianus]
MVLLRYVAACVLCMIVTSSPAERRGTITKKAWWNLSYQMIDIFGLGISASVLDYGCYCGYHGYGIPVDNIDSCCQVHDNCYGNVEAEGKCWWHPKWTGYDYIISDKIVECTDEAGSCDWDVCMCDKLYVDCIHDHIEEYNDDNYNVNVTARC